MNDGLTIRILHTRTTPPHRPFDRERDDPEPFPYPPPLGLVKEVCENTLPWAGNVISLDERRGAESGSDQQGDRLA